MSEFKTKGIFTESTVPLEHVSSDAAFPSAVTTDTQVDLRNPTTTVKIGDNEFRKALIRTPSSKMAEEQKKHIFTFSSGRNSTVPIRLEVNGEIFHWAVIKGNGSRPAFKETGSPYSRNDTRFTTYNENHRGLATGLLTKSEAYKDAEVSLKLHALGFRVRIPIAGFNLEQVPLDGKTVPASEFIQTYVDKDYQEGEHSELPYVEVMAMRNAVRTSEVHSAVEKAVKSGNFAELRFLVVNALKNSQEDSLPEYQNVANRYKHLLEAEIKNIEPVDIFKVMYTYATEYATQLGQQFGKLHALKMVHKNPNDQNFGFFSAEIADLVSLQENPSRQEIIKELEGVLSGVKGLKYVLRMLFMAAIGKEDVYSEAQDIMTEKFATELEKLFWCSYQKSNPDLFENNTKSWDDLLTELYDYDYQV